MGERQGFFTHEARTQGKPMKGLQGESSSASAIQRAQRYICAYGLIPGSWVGRGQCGLRRERHAFAQSGDKAVKGVCFKRPLHAVAAGVRLGVADTS